jgi:hypothetical protein
LENGSKLVIAVRALIQDPEIQIDFGEGAEAEAGRHQ